MSSSSASTTRRVARSVVDTCSHTLLEIIILTGLSLVEVRVIVVVVVEVLRIEELVEFLLGALIAISRN